MTTSSFPVKTKRGTIDHTGKPPLIWVSWCCQQIRVQCCDCSLYIHSPPGCDTFSPIKSTCEFMSECPETGAAVWTHCLWAHRVHSLAYVFPSLPHTGARFRGHATIFSSMSGQEGCQKKKHQENTSFVTIAINSITIQFLNNTLTYTITYCFIAFSLLHEHAHCPHIAPSCMYTQSHVSIKKMQHLSQQPRVLFSSCKESRWLL